ncbi:MAG: Hpt domain-containing protein [Bauldia sp.]|nr:Hpt domain-containing protein [Bauldia sp.]
MEERASLQALIERHCATLRANTELIGQLIGSMAGPDGGTAARQALDLAHQVAGAGGSIGFRAVSTAARAVEQELKRAIQAPAASSRAALIVRFQTLRETVAAVRPEESSLYKLDFARLGAPRRDRR